jgi:hypothetical protein
MMTELVPSWLGGPDSALLYVTLHFIINPVIAVGVACAIMLHGAVQQRLLRKVVGLVIGLLPLWVTYIGITGSTWLTEALGVQFHR